MNSETSPSAETTAPASPPYSPSEIPKTDNPGTISVGLQKAASPADEIPDDIYDHLTGELTRCAANSIGWWIRAGQILLEAKEQLPAGDLPRILSARRLPLGARSAQILLRIAGNKALCDPKLLFHLPRSISALNELAALDGGRIQEAIKAGIIGPTTTAKEVAAFVKQKDSNRATIQNAESSHPAP